MRATINELSDVNSDHDAAIEPKSLWQKMCNKLCLIYKSKNNHKKTIVISLVGAISAIIIGIIIFENKSSVQVASSQSKISLGILNKLNDIDNQLDVMSHNPNNLKQQQVLQAIDKDVATIQQSVIDVAKTADIQKVSNQISSVKDDVDSQMIELKRAVTEGAGAKEYLEESALPFHVVSVDVIAGQPYVSVNFENHVTPLGITDSLGGWRLIVADYDTRTAEFVNEKKQYAKISLQE